MSEFDDFLRTMKTQFDEPPPGKLTPFKSRFLAMAKGAGLFNAFDVDEAVAKTSVYWAHRMRKEAPLRWDRARVNLQFDFDPDTGAFYDIHSDAWRAWRREKGEENPDPDAWFLMMLDKAYDPDRPRLPARRIEHKDNAAQLSPLLKAIDPILADPVKIARKYLARYPRFRAEREGNFTKDEIACMIADKIISEYAQLAAAAGGATALTGVVPGLGAAVAILGGGMADTTLSMKFQIEMVMAIAVVYGYDITTEEYKRLYFLIAGLGAISHAAEAKAKAIGAKAFIKLVEAHLKGPTLVAVKQVFKKVGIIFARKTLVKAIPFGVGVVVGGVMGQVLTRYVGYKAKDFFKDSSKGTAPMLGQTGDDSAEEEQ